MIVYDFDKDSSIMGRDFCVFPDVFNRGVAESR